MRRLPRARGPQAVGQDREQALPGLRIASGVLHGSGDAHARLVALSSADRVSTANKAVGVGGGTRRSLERAVTLGDGWMPSFRLPADRVAQMLATVDPPEGFTVALAVVPPVNPIGDLPVPEPRWTNELGSARTWLSWGFRTHPSASSSSSWTRSAVWRPR